MATSPPSPLSARVQEAVKGRYTLAGELLGGGMSTVFIADDNTLARRVVIKVLSRELAGSDSVDRFRREIALLASLQHPQIVPILDAGDAEGLPYFVMPFVDGVSLRTRLARGPLSIRETVSTLVDVTRALAFAHSKGVVHRDIKPENILLTQASAVVADFGISKVIGTVAQRRLPSIPGSGEGGITREGTSLGTPAYMSPEQIVGDPSVDYRADLYALGIIAYEMLTGSTPFGVMEPHKIIAAQMTEAPPPIAKRRYDVPVRLDALIAQCLEKDRTRRPKSAADILRALQNPELLDDTPASGATRRSDGKQSSLGSRFRRGFMNFFRSDIMSAARSLLRAPVFTLSAVFCLALGIGATAAIASAIDRALLEPLPFKDPSRLVTVYRVAPHANANTWPFSAPNYSDLASGTHAFESMAAIATGSALVTLPGDAVQSSRNRVTGRFFDLLGVHPLAGRLIAPSDDDPGQNRVVVLSEEFWRKYFGADRGLISKTIQLNGEAATVIGILPAGFRVPHGASVIRADVWEPMRFTPSELGERGSNYLLAIGRLAPNASLENAEQDIAGIYQRLGATFPDMRDDRTRIAPLQADGVSTVKTPLLLLFGAVVLVLLIATTNVASLLLARGVQRRREMAVRTAIGASRWDVMRPVLAESALISAAGALCGLGLAMAGVTTIGKVAAIRMPQLAGLSVDMRIIWFALALSALVALLCGAIPAWRATQADPQDALRGGRGGGAGRGHLRALDLLVVVEVALSLVLLISAGLMLKGFTKLLQSSPGFDPAPMLAMDVRVSPKAYADGTSARQFLEPSLAAIARDPGVAAAGAITMLPYDNWGTNFGIRYEGQSGDHAAQRPVVETRVVTPGFFEVTQQRLVSGRWLRSSDEGGAKAGDVVLANEALVKRDFAGHDPTGKRFYTGDTTFATIVGVVSDIRNSGPARAPVPEIYQTYEQAASSSSGFEFVLRVKGNDPIAEASAAAAAIHSVDRGAAISRVRAMNTVISDSVGQPRFLFSLMGVFAAVALVLAVAGLYGVMSYVVAQRTRELGIRAALGSTSSRTLRLVARRGAALIGAGIVLGFIASRAITGFLASMLYGVSPADAATWGLAAVAIAVAGMTAVLVPSIRATRVDPVRAIRIE